MKTPYYSVFIILWIFFLISGCSNEEQADEEQSFPKENTTIRRPIIKPERKKVVSTPEIPEAKLNMEIDVSSEEQEAVKEKALEKKGFYTVKKGETLIKIASMSKVYADPLKWPILYRLNVEKLGKIGTDVNAPEREITQGIRLKLSDPDEVAEKIRNRAKEYWVINVQSSPENERIIPNAITLIKKGYPVYLTQIELKGEDWTRLRVGFFKIKEEADTEGKKLGELMNISDVWVTKAGEQETKEFIGYL